jgi:hypothetical protein
MEHGNRTAHKPSRSQMIGLEEKSFENLASKSYSGPWISFLAPTFHPMDWASSIKQALIDSSLAALILATGSRQPMDAQEAVCTHSLKTFATPFVN